MKKIGKEVLFLGTGPHNPRNGESTMVRLLDGRIRFVYTQYYGDDWEDHATARICTCTSADEGETWSEPKIMIVKPENAQNIMSPSLLRLADGGLGMIYLRKDVQEDRGVSCMPVFQRSDDEGETWSEPVNCGLPLGYYCGINDGALVTKEGGIRMAISYHGPRYDALGQMNPKPVPHPGDIRIACSDDNGKSWYSHPHVFEPPYGDLTGLAEPGLYEFDNGDLWMYCRTAYGHQYQSLSADGGEGWSPVVPNFRFTTPDAPMRVKAVGPYTAAVYNPIAWNVLRTDKEIWKSPKRTPLAVSLSKDGGRSFTDVRTIANGALDAFAAATWLLEDDPADSYCYPSIIETKDGFLVSYYHSAGSDICLNASKITKVYWSEIE